MIPGIPAKSWRALEHAKALGFDVKVKQMAAQWIAVVDGVVAHIDDAPKLLREAQNRREKVAA